MNNILIQSARKLRLSGLLSSLELRLSEAQSHCNRAKSLKRVAESLKRVKGPGMHQFCVRVACLLNSPCGHSSVASIVLRLVQQPQSGWAHRWSVARKNPHKLLWQMAWCSSLFAGVNHTGSRLAIAPATRRRALPALATCFRKGGRAGSLSRTIVLPIGNFMDRPVARR
jgi:hypothetical protein